VIKIVYLLRRYNPDLVIFVKNRQIDVIPVPFFAPVKNHWRAENQINIVINHPGANVTPFPGKSPHQKRPGHVGNVINRRHHPRISRFAANDNYPAAIQE